MPNKNKVYLTIVFSLFFVSLMIFVLVFRINMTGNVILEEREIPTNFIIDSISGFNVTTDSISFGAIVPGGMAKREDLIIKNDYDFPIRVEFEIIGNIEKFVNYEKEIYLDIGEEKNIKFRIRVPKNEPFGEYSGDIIIRIYRDIF